jgi:hypothetical protein
LGVGRRNDEILSNSIPRDGLKTEDNVILKGERM